MNISFNIIICVFYIVSFWARYERFDHMKKQVLVTIATLLLPCNAEQSNVDHLQM